MKKIFIAPGVIVGSIYFSVAQAETLKITAIDWCPQLCSSPDKPGYVLDTLKAVFKDSPYTLSVNTYPWTRSIDQVETGAAHALLAPAKSEAPNLLYPENPIGIQRMCFITGKDSDWTYSGIESLKNMSIGIAKDTSIKELNGYIESNKKSFQFMPYNDTYLKKSLRKLDGNRFDAFIFTYNTTMYELNKLAVTSKYRMAGCVSKEYIYVAFSPSDKNSKIVSAAIEYYDRKINELHNKGVISDIMTSYQLENWKDIQ